MFDVDPAKGEFVFIVKYSRVRGYRSIPTRVVSLPMPGPVLDTDGGVGSRSSGLGNHPICYRK